jgi:hypothetical protein
MPSAVRLDPAASRGPRRPAARPGARLGHADPRRVADPTWSWGLPASCINKRWWVILGLAELIPITSEVAPRARRPHNNRMAKRVQPLREVVSGQRAEDAREVRRTLFDRCRAAVDQMGDDIAGFAVVVWNREGHLRSAYDAARGPIRAPLVPTLAADALNRHLAVMLAEERLAGESEG